MNHTTGTRQASISAWSKQVPAAGWDAAPPLADNGDHALAGFAGYPQQGQDDQYNQTNNFMPPQPQMMHTVTTTNAVGLEQPSPAMTKFVGPVRAICKG